MSTAPCAVDPLYVGRHCVSWARQLLQLRCLNSHGRVLLKQDELAPHVAELERLEHELAALKLFYASSIDGGGGGGDGAVAPFSGDVAKHETFDPENTTHSALKGVLIKRKTRRTAVQVDHAAPDTLDDGIATIFDAATRRIGPTPPSSSSSSSSSSSASVQPGGALGPTDTGSGGGAKPGMRIALRPSMCAELPLPSLENWYDAGHSNYSSCCWTASWDAASLLRGIFDAPPTRRLSAPRLALPVNRLQGLNELWEILLFHAPDTIRRIVEKRDGAAVDDTHEVGAAVASDDSAGADEHDCQVSGVLFAF